MGWYKLTVSKRLHRLNKATKQSSENSYQLEWSKQNESYESDTCSNDLNKSRESFVMNTHSFLAIKKQNRSNKQATKQSFKNAADEYIRDNFVVWQYTQYDGFFEGHGVKIWEFLWKFVNEWTDEQRSDYVNNLDLIQEASDEFANKAEKWYNDERIRYLGSFLKASLKSSTPKEYDFKNEITKNGKFYEYVPGTIFCGSMIFDIIDTQKGHVKTTFTHSTWPLDAVFCEFGYIVDFDRSELHVMHNKTGYKCQLLEPLENFHGYRGLKLVKTFKFNRLPTTKEDFLGALNACIKKIENRVLSNDIY